MSIVVFTRPDGKPIAVNASQWQTVTEDLDAPKGAKTQIGFSGPAAAIQVTEAYDEVIKRLKGAEKPLGEGRRR